MMHIGGSQIMFRTRKGSYGYLKRRKKQLMFHVGLVLAGMAILIALGIYSTGTRKNLLTIVAVVSALPLANELVVLIAIWPYTSRPREEYDKVREITGNGVLDTELIITSKTDKAIEVNYAYVHEKGVFCFTADKKTDHAKAAEYIESFLEKNDLKADVFFMRDWKKFVSRIKELSPEDRNTCDESLLRIEGVLRAISI